MEQNNSVLSVIKKELAKIAGLPRGKRWEYIWEYYRLEFFITVFAVFVLWMTGTFLVNGFLNTFFPKDPISIAFAITDFADNPQWTEDCLTAIGYDEKQEEFRMLTSAPHRDTVEDFRVVTSVWLVNGQPDIFIVDEHTYRYLLELEALADLTEAWPEDLRQLAGEWMADAWHLDISDTAFAEAFGLTEEPVYLCMYFNGSGFTRALDIVRYILAEG